jgi:hypothetical protein
MLVAAILELRAVVNDGSAEQIAAAIDVFKKKALIYDLEPRELAEEVAKAEHMLTVLGYAERLGRGEGVQALLILPDGERVFFRAPKVSRETARDDDYGHLDIGEKSIVYEGKKHVRIGWRKIRAIERNIESLVIHPNGGKPETFYLQSEREALLAHTIASTIVGQHPTTGTSRQPPPAMEGWGYISAVGDSQYQAALRIVSRAGRLCWATLVPEPENPFDSNAVVVRIEGATVGYLSRDDARRYQKRLLQLTAPLEVPAKLIGGTSDKPSFGVLLDCREVEALPKPVRTRKKKVDVDPTDQPF